MSSYGILNWDVCDNLPFLQTVIIHTVRLAHLTCVALKEEKSLSWMKLCIHKQVISLNLVLCRGKICLNVCIDLLTR